MNNSTANLFIKLVNFYFLFYSKLISLPTFDLTTLLKPSALEGYSNEEYADNFAREHGYAVAVASSMNKLHRLMESGSDGKKYKRLSQAAELLQYGVALVLAPLDEHPTNYTRIMNSYKYLEKEAEKEKDPRIKKIIIKNRNNTKKILDDFNENSSSIAKALYSGQDFLKHSLFSIIFGTSLSDMEERYEKKKEKQERKFLFLK